MPGEANKSLDRSAWFVARESLLALEEEPPMRPIVALIALLLPTAAAFATPPSGSITCSSIVGLVQYRRFLPTVVAQDTYGYADRIKVKLKNAQGACDASGVTGGKYAISAVSFDLLGRLPAGTDCSALTGTAPFEKTKLTATWKSGQGPGVVVGRSKATLASAIYDANTDELVFTTNPITRGAFAGSTLTFRMGLIQPDYDDVCATHDLLYAGHFIGPQPNVPDNAPSSVSVP
jgi:hypothetical protein